MNTKSTAKTPILDDDYIWFGITLNPITQTMKLAGIAETKIDCYEMIEKNSEEDDCYRRCFQLGHPEELSDLCEWFAECGIPALDRVVLLEQMQNHFKTVLSQSRKETDATESQESE